MSKWLEIRSLILGLNREKCADSFHQWGYLLASFQIFDDLKDIPLDLKKQVNFPLQKAFHQYPNEYHWCVSHYQNYSFAIDRNDVLLLSFHMKKTIFDCLQYSRLISVAFLNWFSHYVVDFRWRRNWFVRKNSFHYAPRKDLVLENQVDPKLRRSISTQTPFITSIFCVVAETFSLGIKQNFSDEYFAWVLDLVGYDYGWSIILKALPNLRLSYRYLFLRTIMSPKEKTFLLRKICKIYKTETLDALKSLRWITGSSHFTHKVADALLLHAPAFHS